MALGQTVELEVEGGSAPIRVRYTAVDLRRYEAQFKKSVLVEPMSLTMLTFLGWSAARRTGQLNGTYARWEAFDAACTSVRTVPAEDTDADRPTEPRRTGRTPKTPTGG